jgi:hypothetical protein
VEEAAASVAPLTRPRYDTVRTAVAELDTGDGLPRVFTHPDFVMANVVVPGDGRIVVVDGSGAGRASRMWSLAFLLWSVGFGGDRGIPAIRESARPRRPDGAHGGEGAERVRPESAGRIVRVMPAGGPSG